MAAPQLENGYTRIANELLEALLRYHCSGAQKDIILAVIRATYGFQRKIREIGAAYLAELTGRNRRRVASDVAVLIQRKVFIEVKRYGFNRCRTLGLNKNFDEWVCAKQLIGYVLNSSQGMSETAHLPMSETVHPIKKVKKVHSVSEKKTNRSSINHEKKNRQGTWSTVTLFKQWWAEECRRRNGEKYLFSHGKDEKLIKEMLDACGGNLESLKGKALMFFQQDDEFVREKGGHTVGVFRARFNALRANGTPKPKQPEPTFAQRHFAKEVRS